MCFVFLWENGKVKDTHVASKQYMSRGKNRCARVCVLCRLVWRLKKILLLIRTRNEISQWGNYIIVSETTISMNTCEWEREWACSPSLLLIAIIILLLAIIITQPNLIPLNKLFHTLYTWLSFNFSFLISFSCF
jgi:hypothetical protein